MPDACLINRYEPGARLSLHQDRNERDFAEPIVSVSLGLPAVFQFGGLKRTDPVEKYALKHGDVAVWGGPSRLRFHGVATAEGWRPPEARAHADQPDPPPRPLTLTQLAQIWGCGLGKSMR